MCNWFSGPGVAPMSPPEDKVLVIDTVSQSKLNTIKIMKFDINFLISVLGL